MNEEMKTFLMFISSEIKELDAKLKVIEDLLGSPHAAQYSEVMLDAMVNDVLKYQGMVHDLAKFGSGIVAEYVSDKVWAKMKEHPVLGELLKRMESDG